MIEENKAVELEDKQLSQVSGGGITHVTDGKCGKNKVLRDGICSMPEMADAVTSEDRHPCEGCKYWLLSQSLF